MEKYFVLMDWKNWYCQNVNTMEKPSTDSMQYLKISTAFFFRNRTNNSEFLRKHKRPQVAKAILRKKRTKPEASCLQMSDYITKL